MPIFLSAAFNLNKFNKVSFINFIGFTVASILILFWENLTNDLFDSETGIDEFKLHSIVNLVKNKHIISVIAYFSLLFGLLIIFIISFSTNKYVLVLVIGCCILGYLYQGPPFRLGYMGLGEPLCWIAFGPLAFCSALIALDPSANYLSSLPWRESLLLGSGPSLAITLVLFCSHFHQVKEDKKYGKNSPLVRMGTKRGSLIIPLVICLIYLFQLFTIFIGFIPKFCLFFFISIPHAYKLTRLITKSHNQPKAIQNCKFIAIKFQTLNGAGLIIGLLCNYFFA